MPHLSNQPTVMAGLDPAIQGNKQKSLFGALIARRLDGRIKRGHDEE